jgi:phosphotransferase system IIB component
MSAVERQEIAAAVVDASAVIAAVGGTTNVLRTAANATRICVDVANAERIDEAALRRAGVRSVARLGAHTLHLVVGPGAAGMHASLRANGVAV